MSAQARDSYDNLRDVFERFDKDNSGSLEKTELPEALNELGLHYSEGELSATFAEMDSNGDGQVDLEEFERAVSRMQASKDPLLRADEMTVHEQGGNWLRDMVDESDSWKEEARKGRRTIFNEVDWKNYRSSYRIIDNLFGSTIFIRGLWLELSLEVAMALGILSANKLIDTHVIPVPYENFHLYLPVLPFSLTAPAIGLLLVFRNNAAYGRYSLARQLWGQALDSTRDLVRMGLVSIKGREEKEELARRAVSFLYVLKAHVRSPKTEGKATQKALTKLLGSTETGRILAEKNRPATVLQDISVLLKQESEAIPPPVRGKIDKAISDMNGAAGNMERMFKQPLPLVYTRFSGRYLGLWVLLMPLALWKELQGSWALVPVSVFFSVFFFGIDELGVSIEEPFSIMPMETACETLQNSVASMLKNDLKAETDRPAIGDDAAPFN